MNQKRDYRFHTRVIHAAQSPEDWQGATLPPIFQAASHLHPTAENLSQTFAGQRTDHIYIRLTNPTNRVLEEKLSALEGGLGAVVMSSGMAAISNTCMALLRAGDEFVAGSSLFMSTYLFFTSILKKYKITARLVVPTDTEAIERAINSRSRFVYLETIGNPRMDIPDLARVAEITHRHGVPLVIDNTLATPYLCQPIELCADKDFRKFSKEVGFEIVKEAAINTSNHDKRGNIVNFLPNLRATYGVFLIGKGKS